MEFVATTGSPSTVTSTTLSINADFCKHDPSKRKPIVPAKPKYIPPMPTPTPMASLGKLNQQKLAALAKYTGHQQLILECQKQNSQACLAIENKQNRSNSNNNNYVKSTSRTEQQSDEVDNLTRLKSKQFSCSQPADNLRSQSLSPHSIDDSGVGIKSTFTSISPYKAVEYKDPAKQIRLKQGTAKLMPFLAATTTTTKSTTMPIESTSHRKHSDEFSLDNNSKQHLEEVLAQQQRLLNDNVKESCNSRLRILLGKKQRSASNSLDGAFVTTSAYSTVTYGALPQHAQKPTTSSSDLNISTIGTKNLQQMLFKEVKKNCRLIQEKHLIEKRLPQQYYKPLDEQSDQLVMCNSKIFSFLFIFVDIL